MTLRALFAFTLCAIGVPADAALVRTFDFEGVAPSQGVNNRVDFTGPHTIVSGGLSMTITHESNITYSFNERIGVNFIAQFGFRALSAFNGNQGPTTPGAFILDFDRELTSAIVEMGDIGQDEDNLLLQAYSGAGGTGTLLASDTGFLPPGGNSFGFDTLSVTGSGIRSIRMIGGGAAFPNSVFYDNIVVTAVPEPSTAATSCLFAAALAFRRRRPHRSSAKTGECV